jgi:hypothetical protein
MLFKRIFKKLETKISLLWDLFPENFEDMSNHLAIITSVFSSIKDATANISTYSPLFALTFRVRIRGQVGALL